MCLHIFVVLIWFWCFCGLLLAQQLFVFARNHKVAANWSYQQNTVSQCSLHRTWESTHEKYWTCVMFQSWTRNLSKSTTLLSLWVNREWWRRCRSRGCAEAPVLLREVDDGLPSKRKVFFLDLKLMSWKLKAKQTKAKLVRCIQCWNQ